MKHFVLFFAWFLCSLPVFAQKQEHYSRAKIYFDATGHNMQTLSALGIAVDHGEYKKNTFFVSDFSDTELNLAQNAGFKTEIVIADVVAHYQNQNKTAEKTTSVTCNLPAVDVPAHFHLGSYAGFFYYSELLAILDSMQLLYPGLISVRQPIDTFHTIQGRPIYWIRLSNNPGVDQPAKPQVLYTALHHAREPGSISSTVFYLWYLLEHYSTDAHIKALIDNEEMYFIPCINPDGYLNDSAIASGGGGMWRKNMRDNLDGTFGVDLNRNYGYFWGYDNVGSSPTTSSDTYRGTTGFSEPETQAVKWFTENHHFKITLNYHTYNNDIIYPWGYIGSFQTVDSSLFFAYGSYLTQYNHYRYGTCNQTLDYITNGDSDDWMYGDTSTKAKVFGMTPEVGLNEYGFYPPATQIIPDCQNNLLSNINTASLLLPFATIQSDDNMIQVQPSGYIHYTLQRLGFPDADTFTVKAIPLDSWLTLPITPHVYNNLAILQQVNDSFTYTIATGTPNGQLIRYVLQVYNGYYYVNDTVSFYNGKYHTVTTPSTATLADWTTTGWGVCTATYFTPPSSIKSSMSCSSNYLDNEDISLMLTNPIDLTYSSEAYLQFETRWAIESNYDYVVVSASMDGGATWAPLCGNHTKNGTLYQLHNEPIYDGQQPAWIMEQMSLADYLGQHVMIKYELVSDPAVDYEGYYVDNVIITTVQDTPSSVKLNEKTIASINVSPNPAQGSFILSVTGYNFNTPLHGILYDCVGRVAREITLSQPDTKVDISGLPGNVYYMKIVDGNKQFPVLKVDVIQ